MSTHLLVSFFLYSFFSYIYNTNKPLYSLFLVKETMLTFTGTTVSESRKYLHFHNTQHTFKPVRIGIEQAPIQTYTLYNNGVVPVEYEVDPSPLEKFHKENHGFEIFSCQKTKGFILPGDYDLVKFIFTPIEAKMYEVDIPIKMNDGRVQIVTFKGEGINEPVSLYFLLIFHSCQNVNTKKIPPCSSFLLKGHSIHRRTR